MRIDLLWWRHLRPPRPHVAEPRVVDMDAALARIWPGSLTEYLALITTAVSGPTIDLDERVERGSYVWHDGKMVRVGACWDEAADDWLSPPRWRAHVESSRSFVPTRIRWVEDEAMPRFTQGRGETPPEPSFY